MVVYFISTLHGFVLLNMIISLTKHNYALSIYLGWNEYS